MRPFRRYRKATARNSNGKHCPKCGAVPFEPCVLTTTGFRQEPPMSNRYVFAEPGSIAQVMHPERR